jgi:pimeloyl-ACP methyl ester carboxylesterase
VAGLKTPVALVGHSYGGSVISEAATKGGNIKSLAYVSAFAPDVGESEIRNAGRLTVVLPDLHLHHVGLHRNQISSFPEPIFEAADDPASFQDALVYHMRRFADSYWQLYRAVVHLNETFDNKAALAAKILNQVWEAV